MEDVKVTVVKFGDREHLQMQYVCPITQKKKTRSTKTANRREAERAAAKWEAELREGRYHAPGRTTWEAFRERYENEVLSGLADRTDGRVACVFNHVERILNPQKLRDLTAARISHFVAELRKERKDGKRTRRGCAESTIASTLAHLRAALQWAVTVGLLPIMPKIDRPKRAKGGKLMKGRPVTGEEFERMLEKIPAAFKPTGNADKPVELPAGLVASWEHYLRGLWLSGLRLAESLELYWDRDDKLCVDMTGKRPMLRIPAELEKGHQDRLLPIAPEFVEFLLQTPQAERSGPVFNPRARRVKGLRPSPWWVSRVVCKIGEAAGVKVNTDARTGRVKFASAHDLRRSFGERWSSRVMPQVLMMLMRHESIDTTMKYYVGRNAQATADVLWDAHNAAGSNTSSNKAPSAQSHHIAK